MSRSRATTRNCSSSLSSPASWTRGRARSSTAMPATTTPGSCPMASGGSPGSRAGAGHRSAPSRDFPMWRAGARWSLAKRSASSPTASPRRGASRATSTDGSGSTRCWPGLAPGGGPGGGGVVSAEGDLGASVPRLGDAVRGGHAQLALATRLNADALDGDAALHQVVAHPLGALDRERVVVLVAPHRVCVADHHHLGRRAPGDLGEDLADHLLGLGRELVPGLEEVEREGGGARGQGGEGGAEDLADLLLRRPALLDPALDRDPRGVIWLVEHLLLGAMGHGDGRGVSVLRGEQDIEVVAGGTRAAGPERPRDHEQAERDSASPPSHRGSVPLTGRPR